MDDWRSRAWYQIGALEQALGGPLAADPEVARRRDLWTAIDRFSWPQYKEPQFAQLEAATRAEVDLLRYMLASPPMRDLLATKEAPDLPAAPADVRDWRGRALHQIAALAGLLGKDDPEVRRRALMWLAIERYDWPQAREQQFARLDFATHAEAGLVHYLFQNPQARERIAKPPAGATATAPVAAAEGATDDGADPLGALAEIEPYRGPPAPVLLLDASSAWNDYVAAAKTDKPRAREAARKLRAILTILDKNPEGEEAMREMEKRMGTTFEKVLANELEARLDAT
jgi:hypothetical protein